MVFISCERARAERGRAGTRGIINRVGSNRAFIAPLAPIDQAICHPIAQSPAPPPPSLPTGGRLSGGRRGTSSSAWKLNLRHCAGRSVGRSVGADRSRGPSTEPALPLSLSPLKMAVVVSFLQVQVSFSKSELKMAVRRASGNPATDLQMRLRRQVRSKLRLPFPARSLH